MAKISYPQESREGGARRTLRASRAARTIRRALQPLRAATRAGIFFLKVFPMLPSRPVDWVTPAPRVDRVRYPTLSGETEGDVYRPSTPGPHPGVVVCLGVVPFGVDHPQVPVLGKALARAGFAALLYWSPAMRDFRLDPQDVENISLAYHWFVGQPYIDSTRSGLLGTCVGGAFALMAAAAPRIREEVAFVSAYAPFSSMRTFARDIASASVDAAESVDAAPGGRAPWKVDQLTRKVFLHSITAWLEPAEAALLRGAFSGGESRVEKGSLSAGGRAILALLRAKDGQEAAQALHDMPPEMRARLKTLSPVNYLGDLRAPRIILLHDRGDQVIPVGESRRLVAALAGRPGVRYTEMQFSHLDPVKGRLPPHRLVRELGKFFTAVLPIFQQSVG